MIDLFLTFFKIGITTFGGGYAMLPILVREIVENKKWATEEELLEYFAIGQATPGIIAVNTSGFIGYKHKGIAGAFVATLGFILPSILIISTIYKFIDKIEDRFELATRLVKITVTALIVHTLYNMFRKNINSVRTVIIMLVALILAMMGISLPLILSLAVLYAIVEVILCFG